jgi:hypothetical protein
MNVVNRFSGEVISSGDARLPRRKHRVRHAGKDGRHPGRKDASGDIPVDLDSITPCWNDVIGAPLLQMSEVALAIFLKASR